MSFFKKFDIGCFPDAAGNLKDRHNQSALSDLSGHKDLKESFCYDGLNRLIKAHRGTLFGSCNLSAAEQDVEYDGLGNIARKTGMGLYKYGTASHTQAGPHAVTEAGGVTYSYDANGNQTGGDGRSLEYNSFDKPTQITKGDHTTTFKYGPSRSRYLRTDQVDNPDTGLAPKKTTRYIGNVERIQTEGQNTITWRRHLGGAVYTIKTDTNFQPLSGEDANSRHYVYQDHLGSTDVITDHEGIVIQSMSFDAWGQRRNEQDWDAIIGADQLAHFDTDITNRGFTGHEQLDEVGLIHMNGRVYDPKLGRFLQADPFIQEADNTQSYNRYSYVINNPLNATDPSGFIFGKIFKGLNKLFGDFAPIVSIAVSAFLPGAAIWGSLANSFASTVASGFVAGGIATGSVKGAGFGALSAAAFFGAGSAFEGCTKCSGNFFGSKLKPGAFFGKVGAHGIIGGGTTVMQGGKFDHGFVAAGTNQLFSGQIDSLGNGSDRFSPARVFASAALGGTVSEVTGGKFSNGAVTAAFARAFNDEAHKELRSDEASSEESLAERNRRFREKNGPTLNPFKIIAKEFPEWWFSGETEDLRNGISLTVDSAAIPVKSLRLLSDSLSAGEVLNNFLSGNVREAFIGSASIIGGQGAGHFLKNFSDNDQFIRAVSTGVQKSSSEVISEDCLVCK